MKRVALVLGSTLLLFLASNPAAAGPRRGGAADHALQVRFGAFFPEGGGDLWNENEAVFTLDVSDFDDFALGFTYLVGLGNRFEVGFNADFYDETVLSGYRDFVDSAGFPILHDTTLESVPLTLDLRFLPAGRYRIRAQGRRVLQPVFYVGGGLGLALWEYKEVGDFIDFADPAMPIFLARFRDSGTAFETHVLAGVELPLNRGFNVLLEGRRSWIDDTLQDDFGGLGRIELGGSSFFVGGVFRF